MTYQVVGATGGLSAREGVARADKPPVAPDPAGRFFPVACLTRTTSLGGVLTCLRRAPSPCGEGGFTQSATPHRPMP